ncbi:hypothetical protein GCG21_08595 [Pseudactinotalea sp. HY160]|uniref:hypothetical protein n=1 Tax=Pseudactinotalea sp. HY160 TaxID=2654490 RepID=UPI00128BC4CE|nr:hypothetical protein [Pseudactinotalea sp. HY160]MPV50062.1 hypothetical protein [Pseudactinotalea sp. HY160]
MSLPARQMAGTPAGGQFAPVAKARPSTVLRPIRPDDVPNQPSTTDEPGTASTHGTATPKPEIGFFEAVRMAAADPIGPVRHVGSNGTEWFDEPLFDDEPNRAREWAGEGPLTI